MKTIDLLNSYLADLTVVERNIHILHWNVNGKSFKSVHEYLENIYKDIYNKIDEIAEMIRIHGEIPDANLSDNVEKSIIEEIESKNKFNHIEAIGLAKQDIEKLMDKLNELFEASESDKLYDVNDSIGSYIADFGKFKYFLENFIDQDNEIKDTVDIKELDKDEDKDEDTIPKDNLSLDKPLL